MHEEIENVCLCNNGQNKQDLIFRGEILCISCNKNLGLRSNQSFSEKSVSDSTEIPLEGHAEGSNVNSEINSDKQQFVADLEVILQNPWVQKQVEEIKSDKSIPLLFEQIIDEIWSPRMKTII